MYKINRKNIYFILLIALFFQTALLNHLRIFGAKPDLLLICVVFFSLFLGSGAGLECGILAGVFKDIFALDFFGINTFILGITGFTVGVLNAKFFKDSKTTQLVLVFSFTIFSMMLHFTLVRIFSKAIILSLREYFVTSIIPTGIYTGIISIPIFSKFVEMYKLKELEDIL